MNKEHSVQKTWKGFWSLQDRSAGLAGLIMGVVLVMAGSVAQAAPLGLTQTFPDMSVFDLAFDFVADGDGGQLTISGDPTSLTVENGGNQNPITGGSFSLVADIDGLGVVISGSFTSAGVVLDLDSLPDVLIDGSGAGGLLNGDLDLFGYGGSGAVGTLEFTFTGVTGAVSDVLGPFSEGGMILSLSDSTMTEFDEDVLTTSWTGQGFGDAFVPVPAAVWLFGSSLIGLIGVARRQRRQR